MLKEVICDMFLRLTQPEQAEMLSEYNLMYQKLHRNELCAILMMQNPVGI